MLARASACTCRNCCNKDFKYTDADLHTFWIPDIPNMTSTGMVISCPNCTMLGGNPVLLFTIARIFMPRTGRYLSQSRCLPLRKHRRKFSTIILYRSTWPLELGLYGVVLVLTISSSRQNYFIMVLSKFLPWSICMTKGAPKRMTQISKKARAMLSASCIVRGTISSQWENWSTIMRT